MVNGCCPSVRSTFYFPIGKKTSDAATSNIEQGLVTPVIINVYQDRSFDFTTKSAPAAVLLLKKAGLKSGSGEPNKTKVGKVTEAQVREIAEMKLVDLNTTDIEQAAQSIKGTARSMGITVVP